MSEFGPSNPEEAANQERQQALKSLNITFRDILMTRFVAARHLDEQVGASKTAKEKSDMVKMFREGEHRVVRAALREYTDQLLELFTILGWSEESLTAITDDVAFSGFEEDKNILLDISIDRIEHIEPFRLPDGPAHISTRYKFNTENGQAGTYDMHADLTIFRYDEDGARKDGQPGPRLRIDTHQINALKILLNIVSPELKEYYRHVRGLE